MPDHGPKKTNVSTISCLSYRDVDLGIGFLEKAFGFDPTTVYRDDSGKVVHAQLTFGNGMVMVGPHGEGDFGRQVMTMPSDAGDRCTQAVYVIVENVDAHHARAAKAGADIFMTPRDEEYGGRSYAARDPEGHAWSFGNYDPWQKAEG